ARHRGHLPHERRDALDGNDKDPSRVSRDDATDLGAAAAVFSEWMSPSCDDRATFLLSQELNALDGEPGGGAGCRGVAEPSRDRAARSAPRSEGGLGERAPR